MWMVYRLHALTGDRLVTWKGIKSQFGPGFSQLQPFKAKFTKADGPLAMAMAAYPEAKIEVTKEGLILKPSRPPVATRIIAVR